MSRRARIGLVIAVLFTLLNVGGLFMAAVAGEVMHTTIHCVLALAGALVAWRLAPKRVATY